MPALGPIADSAVRDVPETVSTAGGSGIGSDEREFGITASAASGGTHQEGQLGIPAAPKPSPFEYKATAPIEEVGVRTDGSVDRTQIRSMSQQFQKSVKRFSTDREGGPVQDPPLKPGEPAGAIPTPAWTWKSRSGGAVNVAKEYIGDANPAEVGTTFAYMLGKTETNSAQRIPVAMMEVIHRQEAKPNLGPAGTEILSLAAHPAAADAGRTMIEKAVNESEAHGNGGSVFVHPEDKSSVPFYRKVGFAPEGDGMRLTPSASELWSKQKDGSWTQDKILTEKVGDGQKVLVPKELGGKQFLQDKREEEFSDDEW